MDEGVGQMDDEQLPQRRRRRSRPSPDQHPASPEVLRAAYLDLAARTDVLSWSKGTFAEREGWLWDEVWALARAQRRPAPTRRPRDQVPDPDESSPLFPAGSRRAYRDLAERLRHFVTLGDADFAASATAVWAALWALAEQRGIMELEDNARKSIDMEIVY